MLVNGGLAASCICGYSWMFLSGISDGVRNGGVLLWLMVVRGWYLFIVYNMLVLTMIDHRMIGLESWLHKKLGTLALTILEVHPMQMRVC